MVVDFVEKKSGKWLRLRDEMALNIGITLYTHRTEYGNVI